MITMQREVSSDVAPDVAFAYLADFTTTELWDPGTITTVRVSGDGGVGTRYRNTSRFAGRVSTVDYVVTALRPGQSIDLRGENASVIVCDTITVNARQTGCVITYRVTFAFQGWLKWIEPVLRPAVTRLLDDGVRGLRGELRRIGEQGI
ncbi:SRPBCC family protein [Mycolicibacter hiberniae]|uniref:Polyketide cyclase n=1 Tax=Mycolicibacter hiberniae TaxID=29314 RepID=A0A7I7WWN8_9MYCO|nr:SRPBCC family protein [Mycolicibacter hiberniae]MCV7086788.1 SRPBCC family protein [Mycolicibacter hiberniae]ORV70954.1 polyketide cyclase [Mycolicibacter hiberniae]BBZ21914.1 polyketide cyclase [Mycolicibacter hiberniae]